MLSPTARLSVHAMKNDVAPPLAAGRLKLREVLGEGGVGKVYLAYDETLDVHRAVKVLSEKRASNPIQRQRFLTEARIQARLKHPNIVHVYDIAEDDGRVYLVMELLQGGSLWEALKLDGPLAPRRAAQAIADILGALGLAHEREIIHRDIKPHNILLSAKGVPKLADFGVAHLPNMGELEMTRTGVVMGTWAFMAPEQRASSRRVDQRSDVYAVGATLFTLLTAQTEPDLFDFDVVEAPFTDLPAALRPIVHCATRYSRSHRYPTAQAMRADLLRILPDLETTQTRRAPSAQAPTEAPDSPLHLALSPQPDGPGGATTEERPSSPRLRPLPLPVRSPTRPRPAELPNRRGFALAIRSANW